MRSINQLVVHYTATPHDRHVTVEQIDQWHRARGFKKIGYHYVIYLDGSVHKGRKESEVGAHVLKHNQNSIGVCYVGGLKEGQKGGSNTMNAAQEAALVTLLKDLSARYPDAVVLGHKNLQATQCPAFDVRKWWAKQ
jgi:N-acetylmuramoyl-L-alanine amidase